VAASDVRLRNSQPGMTDAHRQSQEVLEMADLIFVLVTVAFFTLAVAYTSGCERL
jgi:hypothetical protein